MGDVEKRAPAADYGYVRSSADTVRSTLVRTAPTAILLVACIALAWHERGSIAARDWLPYALLAGLLLAAVLWSGSASRPSGLALAGLGGLLALAAWAAVSLAWSPAPALARDEALLTCFYAVALAVPLTTLRTPTERLAATGVLVAASAGLAIATALALRFSADPRDLFDSGRLYFPVSYYNGQAALFAVAFWPGIALAARRTTRLPVRALAFGAGVATLSASLLAQSKGSVAALALSGVVLFALCRSRLRLLLPTLLAAVLVAATMRPLTAPFRADGEAALRHAIATAGAVVLLLTLAATLVGVLYVALDRRFEAPAAVRRLAGAAALLVAAGATVGIVAVAVARSGGAVAAIEEWWEASKTLPSDEAGSSHLLTLGSSRYDFARVALGEFRQHPLAGTGARGFATAYLREGRTWETPARAHSLELDVLSEQGLVGFLLLMSALGVLLVVLARRARSDLVAAGSFAAALYWLVHASVDWLWTLPAVAIPFFCLLGIGGSSERPRHPAPRRRFPLAAAVAALALVAFAPPWLSARFTDQALASEGSAAPDLRWARRLDPLSVDPLVAESVLASSPRARIGPLERAVAIEPRSAALRHTLGVAYLRAGRERAARRTLRVARRLDPRDSFAARELETLGLAR